MGTETVEDRTIEAAELGKLGVDMERIVVTIEAIEGCLVDGNRVGDAEAWLDAFRRIQSLRLRARVSSEAAAATIEAHLGGLENPLSVLGSRGDRPE